MLQSSEGLWALFVAAALGLTILVVALGAAIGIAQHRVLRLHRDYGRQLLTTQDEERAWVAREVHDDAVQRLAVLRHELTLWDKELAALAPDHRRRLAGIQAEIEDLSVALRQLAHRLHPASLDHGHLGFALEQLAEEAGRVLGLSVELALPEGLDVRTSNRVLALYRIAQEALRNVARHAGVERASMTVTLDQRNLTLVVRDEGRGFEQREVDTRPARNGKGIGLLTIQERARLVGGVAEVVSRSGSGTTVRVVIPIAEEPHA